MNKIAYIILAIVLVAGLAGCGDSSTGTETGNEEPPQIPTFENVQPELSFFNQNTAGSKQASNSTTENFEEARITASIGGGHFTAAFFQAIFIAPLRNVEPEFVDGRWEWINTITSQDQGSVTVRLTVAEQDDTNDWVVYISGDDGEGNSYENHVLMRGKVAADGKMGEWTFNALDEQDPTEVPLAKTSWTIQDESRQEAAVDIFDTDTGEVRARVIYEEDQPDFNMVITDFSFEDGPEQFIMEWNTDTNIGSIRDTEEGTTKCWDGNLQDTPC